jgi:hypothetical protein
LPVGVANADSTNWNNGVMWAISSTPPAHPIAAPIFFRLALHGWRQGILDLKPMIGARRRWQYSNSQVVDGRTL